MPEMDGFEATLDWRRAEPQGSRLPIIAMTAGVLAENRARCFTAGMDDFIAKPIDIDALGRALAAWTVADRVRRPDHDAAADQHSKPDRVKPCAVDATRLEVLRHIGPDDGWGMPPAVIEAFLAELPQQHAAVKDAARRDDFGALARAAHTLRGSAANLGAVRVAEVCGLLEAGARSDPAAVDGGPQMRVLVADDDLGSRLVAQAAVESLGHECLAAADGLETWDLFTVWQPEVLVTDRTMPGLDGASLCERIRSVEKDSYTYIVLLTALGHPSDVLTGMRAGADDYVTKPLDPFELEATLLAASRVTRLHEELAIAREELIRQARTDPLTGLRNRLGLADALDQLHTISCRYGRSYCVAVFDVDHFKKFNDIYGHLAGDQALRTVSAALASKVRDSDGVYRYGGKSSWCSSRHKTSPARP